MKWIMVWSTLINETLSQQHMSAALYRCMIQCKNRKWTSGAVPFCERNTNKDFDFISKDLFIIIFYSEALKQREDWSKSPWVIIIFIAAPIMDVAPHFSNKWCQFREWEACESCFALAGWHARPPIFSPPNKSNLSK